MEPSAPSCDHETHSENTAQGPFIAGLSSATDFYTAAWSSVNSDCTTVTDFQEGGILTDQVSLEGPRSSPTYRSATAAWKEASRLPDHYGDCRHTGTSILGRLDWEVPQNFCLTGWLLSGGDTHKHFWRKKNFTADGYVPSICDRILLKLW